MKYVYSLIVLAILFALPVLTLAQPGLPSAPEQAPIDGGLIVLAAGGGAYALKKLSNKKE